MSCNAPIATRLTLATLRREKFEGVERALEREAANQVILILVFIHSSHPHIIGHLLPLSRSQGGDYGIQGEEGASLPWKIKLKMIN